MTDDLKSRISRTSNGLFIAYGYQRVSMRQIASACHISVGNLTYYYPHKEDLLMLAHDEIMHSFLELIDDMPESDGLTGYFTAEAAFLHQILNDPPIASLYQEVINVPSLRNRYCRVHHDLYRRFLQERADTPNAWIATVAMCGMEFQLVQEGEVQKDFPGRMRDIFRARLLTAGCCPDDAEEEIRTGIREGIALSQSHPFTQGMRPEEGSIGS